MTKTGDTTVSADPFSLTNFLRQLNHMNRFKCLGCSHYQSL